MHPTDDLGLDGPTLAQVATARRDEREHLLYGRTRDPLAGLGIGIALVATTVVLLACALIVSVIA